MEYKFIIFISLFLVKAVWAGDCFDRAGVYYHIDSDLLRAIALQESGLNQNATGINHNGSIDVGLMQINSQHAYFLESHGVNMQSLKQDACLNIFVGAYFLSEGFKRWGRNWNAVGAYNAGFKNDSDHIHKRYKYSKRVYQYYVEIKKGLKNKSNSVN
ncbi:lytic transglycosylase [Salmonella enterica]|nr:lytic transglycosylase [Salmonella enterica]EKF0976194.1 transglycosylase SLT domain-containing protein [Salmonella enterica]EKS5988195.1 transglycosylase SLT domain-containing protein [Salmonella enterica]